MRQVLHGNRGYYRLGGFLLRAHAAGRRGLRRPAPRRPDRRPTCATRCRWGFYIGNFTFLVGVAAAAVMLVIPAYVYNWEPIKEVVVLGELLAIAALVMCLLFVTGGHGPARPLLAPHRRSSARLNLPISLLAWDVLVLNIYLVLNCGHRNLPHVLRLPRAGTRTRRSSCRWCIFSIPMAVSIHTVTAFLYNGMAARPYWNSAILAPRFLASAFCSGPAILLVLFQVLRRTAGLRSETRRSAKSPS